MNRLTPKHRRIIRITMRTLVACGLPTVVVLFLLAQRRPAWYTPIRISANDLPALRRDLTRDLDDISRQIVQRRPFTISWSETELTRRLAAFPDLWPEAGSDWPPELSDPVVRIDDGSIRIGAFFERAGWRAIVGLRLAIEVVSYPAQSAAAPRARSGASEINSADASQGNSSSVARPGSIEPAATAHLDAADPPHIRLTLIDATVGTLSAPNWLLRRWFDKRLSRTDAFGFQANRGATSPPNPSAPVFAPDPSTIERLFKGVLIGNDFIWPNGKRPFRISRITTAETRLTLHIQPT